MQIAITLPPTWSDFQQAANEVETTMRALVPDAGAEIKLHASRVVETVVLVALITGGSTVIAALIQAIAVMASKREATKIVIKGRFGGDVELPINADPSTMSHAVTAIATMQDPEIHFQ